MFLALQIYNNTNAIFFAGDEGRVCYTEDER